MAKSRKQPTLPAEGMAEDVDEEIDAAAGDVYELTAKRQEVHEREKDARARLIEIMKAKGKDRYTWIDGDERFEVVLEESEKVKVRKAKGQAAAE